MGIHVEGLSVRYRDRVILDNINLDVRDGEFVSVVGRSGTGKSTLLRAMAGFIPCSARNMLTGKLGMVFQDYAVFPWLTVRGNIAFGIDKKTSAKELDAEVDRYLDLLGLSDVASNYPAELSGGQAQRVALGRAFASDPSIVFMDEPFGALDLYTREKMQNWLVEILEKDRNTVLFVTHNIDEAVFLSDRVLVIGMGSILGQFPVQLERPRREEQKYTPEFLSLKKEILDCMER